MSEERPIPEDVAATMRDIGGILGEVMPDNMGFALLIFDFHTKGSMSYMSNAQRGDMIKALEELLGNLKRSPPQSKRKH